MNLFKALFGSSFFQQEMKRNQQYRDNYACCDDIDVNIDFAEEIEDEIQNEKLFLSDYIPESYLSSNPQLSSSASFLRLNVLSSLN